MLLLLVGFGWAATVAHELAHALVIHHAGRRVGRAGFGFYWGSLSFFVDATDALFLPRRWRAAQAAAGPLADATIAGLLGLAVILIGPGDPAAFLGAMMVLLWFDIAVNLVPFLKLDGYWVLADLTDAPDLDERSRRALGRVVRGKHDRNAMVLGGYAALSLTFGLALLCGTIIVWLREFAPLVGEAWGESFLGKVAVAVFCGPLLAGTVAVAVSRLMARPPRSLEHEGR
jgi:putative peptide zinc metalloprotease protein